MDKLPTTVDFQGTVFDEVTPLKGTAEDYFKKHNITRVISESDYQNSDTMVANFIVKFNGGHYALCDMAQKTLIFGKSKNVNKVLKFLKDNNAQMPLSRNPNDKKDEFENLSKIENIGTLDFVKGHGVKFGTIKNHKDIGFEYIRK